MNAKDYSRNIFKTTNKYQERVILLTFMPTMLMFLIFVALVFLGDPIMAKVGIHGTYRDLQLMIHKYSCWMIFLMCVIVILSLYYAFIVTHHMLGGLNRILLELDEIIAGRSKRAIKGRKKDEMMNDILKRVNVLIESYVKNKQQ